MTTIHVAHSPDSDDAFMFYALASGKIDTEGLTYVHQLAKKIIVKDGLFGQNSPPASAWNHATEFKAISHANQRRNTPSAVQIFLSRNQ